MSKLNNKVAVITGGNSGIGYAAAVELAAQGASVVITGRNEEATASAAAELGVVGITSDQANLESIDLLVAEVKERFGKVDIIFLNAGTANFAPFDQASEEHFDSIINVNLKGVFFTLQRFLPLLNDGASVIFNTSINANIGMPNSSVYSASKGALLSLNRVLSTELAPRKIRVNAISPGPVQTPVYEKLGLTEEELAGFGEVLSKKILLQRFGQPHEIAKVVTFLASSDSAFITGTEIVVDGGLTVDSVMN